MSRINIETADGRRIVLTRACPQAHLIRAPSVVTSADELERMHRWGAIPYIMRATGYASLTGAGTLHIMRRAWPRLTLAAAGILAASYALPCNLHLAAKRGDDGRIYVHALDHTNVTLSDDVLRVTREYSDGRVEVLPTQPGHYTLCGNIR